MAHGSPNPRNEVYHGGANPHEFDYVYLYYIWPRKPHDEQIDVYGIPLSAPKALTQADVLKLIADVEAGGVYTLIGRRIEHIPWIRYSYLIFAMRDSTYHFTPGDAVAFHYKFLGGRNHNFRHGQDILDNDLSGMWCVNKRLRKEGGNLGKKTEKFMVTFPNLKLPHVQVSFLTKLLNFFLVGALLRLLGLLEPKGHNESGTNIGP